ncbi:hypothetical protein FAIPA1_230054 [Frankia sp. AiPs1]|uniref:hypothetical protein n=1 Tax=Frankia sp. AiPa1 TaxID=573492 RepID=UPI00202ADDAF|nr:hypothetical protein [Frankia sp. AiPa1]MCL9758757.1 hypothetical protein [Frankia sp. AiPa1]
MERQIAEVMAAYRAGERSAALAFPTVGGLEEEKAQLLAGQSEWARWRAGVPRVTNVAAEWETLELEQRRAIIETVIEAVVLKPPTKKGARTFDAARLEAIWKVT